MRSSAILSDEVVQARRAELEEAKRKLDIGMQKLWHISNFYHDYHAVWGVTTEVDNILGHKGVPKSQPK